jgi:hypothetical protein
MNPILLLPNVLLIDNAESTNILLPNELLIDNGVF